AITDAILGAVGLGDIGTHFPDTDVAYKNADSSYLLSEIWNKVKDMGYRLGNVDCTIIAQKPKMAPYIRNMKENIAKLLDAEISQVNVKATTNRSEEHTSELQSRENIVCRL